MDTSKEYVEMCRKAEEIQTGHVFEYGDWFENIHGVCNTLGFNRIGHNPDYITVSKRGVQLQHIDTAVWLPRQDQLQEMAFTEVKSAVHILRWLDAFTAKNFDTLEKYTLCAVMYTLYDKEWNGEEWVQD